MSEPKRRRTELKHNDTGLREEEEELRRCSLEIETLIIKRKDQPSVTSYRPTYRATLAKHGYLLRETLGYGSYSKVKLAINVNGIGADKVAVKIVDRKKVPRDFQERFLPRELKYWPRLKHQNLVRLHYSFEDARRVYMIIEYAPNGNALSYVQNHHRASEDLARKWVFQIADAVRYMHERDITHRDLKLENILMDGDNNIKMCDFGFIKPETSKDLSRTFCGSKSYASPEILQGRPYDPKKADVWAVGVILYILVTGRMPFDESRGTKHILQEQGSLAFHWPTSVQLSTECKTLIVTCFTWHFPSRISIQDFLRHPWFQCGKLTARHPSPDGHG